MDDFPTFNSIDRRSMDFAWRPLKVESCHSLLVYYLAADPKPRHDTAASVGAAAE